jgi:Cu+-exporting ATPase
MDVLIVIGTSAAYLYSHYLLFHSHNAADAHRGHGTMLYFDTSAMIFTIVLFGKWIESHARTYTQAGFRGLSEQLAGTVTVVRSGAGSDSVKLPAADVRVGDIVLLAPGEKALVDGIVLEGTADMDEAMVTGESASIGKSPGDTIISGSINRNGLLKVAVTAAGDGTFLASMVRLLEDAQISKAPIERLADRISGYFIPVIVGLSILAFGLSYWVFAAESFGSALERAIAVLLIACPCALGLATPVSVLVGTGRASAAGVMMKEGRYLESLCSIDTILLDKTGTLTYGKPMVAKLWTLNRSEDALLRTMAAAEKHSEHPYGAAIVYEAERRKLQLPECSQVETIPGCGIRARVNGERIEIGSYSWMEELGVRLPELYKSVLQQSVRNQTLLFTASNGRCIGMAALNDKVRQTSPETIERLGSMGIRVLMVTGDRMEPARAVAEQLNIPEVYAEMMPQDKVELVHRLQQEGRKVAMIGDGLNDAAALSASHVGIAMGAGNDLTKASADVYIVRNDLLGVVEAVRLSRLTLRNIKQNLVLSLAYNGIAIPFAMMGLLAPWMACSAMALSSVTVIGNALRLKRG